MSFEAACTVGCGIGTLGYALYKVLGLPLPGETKDSEAKKPLLIFGGSTATGTLSIQFARM